MTKYLLTPTRFTRKHLKVFSPACLHKSHWVDPSGFGLMNKLVVSVFPGKAAALGLGFIFLVEERRTCPACFIPGTCNSITCFPELAKPRGEPPMSWVFKALRQETSPKFL